MAASARERLARRAPVALLAAAMAGAAGLLVAYDSELTFFQDSWEYLIHRRSLSVDALLRPHNEHIVLIPVLIFQALLRVFGMSSMLPETVVLIALLLAVAALLFVYVRRRLGPWPALFAAALLLFLGPAWQDLLWPFQIGFVGSSLFGLATLLALENGARRWDAAACGFLLVSIAFSSLGLAFLAGAAVEVLQGRHGGRLRRAYVIAVPLLLYGLWYAGWGDTAENHLTAHNVLVSPRYVAEGLAASLDAVLALGTIAGETVGRSRWSVPLLIVLLVLIAGRQLRRPGFSRRLWPAVAATATFWFLAAFNTMPGREPYSSRYLYVGALFLLLLAANLLQGLRWRRWGLAVGAAVTAVAVGFNLVPLREGRDFLRSQSVLTRADLGAIQIAARTVEPGFRLPPEIAGTVFLNEIEAAGYLRAVREFGSPAYTPAQLAAAPEAGRRQADLVLAHALPVTISAVARPPADGPGCARLRRGGPGRLAMALAPGGSAVIRLGPGGGGKIGLRRFAEGEFPLVDEDLAPGSAVRLQVPPDRARRPWRLRLEAPPGSSVCPS